MALGSSSLHVNSPLMSKGNRSARSFYVFVHFFAVISKTGTLSRDDDDVDENET